MCVCACVCVCECIRMSACIVKIYHWSGTFKLGKLITNITFSLADWQWVAKDNALLTLYPA